MNHLNGYLFYFQGGMYAEGDVAMTAFVLSSLAECKCEGVVCETQNNHYKK